MTLPGVVAPINNDVAWCCCNLKMSQGFNDKALHHMQRWDKSMDGSM